MVGGSDVMMRSGPLDFFLLEVWGNLIQCFIMIRHVGGGVVVCG